MQGRTLTQSPWLAVGKPSRGKSSRIPKPQKQYKAKMRKNYFRSPLVRKSSFSRLYHSTLFYVYIRPDVFIRVWIKLMTMMSFAFAHTIPPGTSTKQNYNDTISLLLSEFTFIKGCLSLSRGYFLGLSSEFQVSYKWYNKDLTLILQFCKNGYTSARNDNFIWPWMDKMAMYSNKLFPGILDKISKNWLRL